MMQEFVNQVKKAAKKATDEMHTAVPATIKSYDPAKGLASVQPVAKFKKPNGETMDYPTISGVPVVFPQSENVTIAFPIKPGDSCLLVFGEKSLDYWLYGKETDTELSFDLSNAVAIPSLKNTGNPAMQKACSEDAVVLQSGGTTLTVKSGVVVIDGDLQVTGKIDAVGDVTDSGISLATHTHTGDSGGSTTGPH